ncbi:MAG: hypothetical protein IJ493_08855 [Clostridia bacterium]|nr:hypothetical protein [Clostridia bacterium]
MRFSIGYQLPDALDSTYELCADYDRYVSDVYFSWSSEPSGRFALCGESDREEVEQIQLEELRAIRGLGKTLTLLLNANCYGGEAVSATLQKRVLGLVEFLKKELDLTQITTTSPFIADTLKQAFGADIQIRASVNMRIGSIAAMEQLAGSFDGYYLKKECNRDFAAIERLHGWCRDHGKTLHLLANSGCLHECAFQTFHDNLIAHQKDGSGDMGVATGFPAPCHKYLHGLERREALAKFMQSNWIRPEDIHRYEPYFGEVKLATRMHNRPRMVLAAYCRGRFDGNLLDLTEPSYSHLFAGTVLDNTRLADDWFERALGCGKRCGDCTVCREAAEEITSYY